MDYEEIISLHLSRLPNGNHSTFNKQSLDIITGDEAVAQEFATQIAAWRAAYEEEDRVMEKITFSELTKRIADADNDRDTLYDMFMRIVRAYVGFTETDKSQAAEKVERYAKQNKVVTTQQYDRETGNLSNFIQDMRQFCQAEVELLGLTDVLDQLDTKNQLVNQLLMERNEEYVDNKHIAVLDARRATDSAYELVRKFINASALLSNTPEKYSRVIALMNQNIERIKLEVFKKKGQQGVDGGATEGEEGGEGGSEEGGEEGGETGGEQETTPTKYTATFVANGATVATQEYEAGAVINAPAAPSGYEWEDYPYWMPANDITVNAVRKNIPGGGGGSGFE